MHIPIVMKPDPLIRVREMILAMPDTFEKEAWGSPTWRAPGGMFAMYSNNHHGDGVVAIQCAAPPMAQERLINSDPARFYRPPYVGPNGWVGVRLDRKIDWKQLAGILYDAYLMHAEKKKASRKPKGRSIGGRESMMRPYLGKS